MKVDEIDRQIINLLFNNGRESLTTIGEKVFKSNHESMSHAGINKRISKLEENDVLRIQGNISVENLNYKSCFILLEMKNYEETKKIIQSYSKCPRVFMLSQVNGRYDLIIGIIGQSIEILHRYINNCGPTNKEGILHSEILFISNLKVPKYIPLNIFSKESQECNCGNQCSSCEAFLSGECDGCGKF
ncbi:MAG: Lrp/AsnC family transcriptional regulator [Candidatus Lokiarchaeota archaeon]|nr:Lrp/AsnC family transcriptional regulator [Candidatus Lokiarchaeota archaeon]